MTNEGIADLLENIRTRSHGATAETWSHRLRLKLRDDLVSDLPADLLLRHARSVLEKIEDPAGAIMALKAELLAQRTNGH